MPYDEQVGLGGEAVSGEMAEAVLLLAVHHPFRQAADLLKALTGLITYLTHQDARLAYDRFRARGLDIGSGQVESACKHVVTARMKRAGMHWSPRGAQANLSLRTVYMNDQWERF